MNEDIKVHVLQRKGRTNLSMRYLDPMTNRHVERSTGTKKQREAEKAAAKWEAELQEGRYQKRSRMSWEEFVDCFEEDFLADRKPSTITNYTTTLRAFERHCRPTRIADLTTARVTAFVREIRKPQPVKGDPKATKKLSEASIARHLRHLKAAARWANRNGYLAKVPVFNMPKKSSGAYRMKGRPITTEEFERMLASTWKVVTKANERDDDQKELTPTEVAVVDSWKLLLNGLWTSGLRISEAMLLRWDQQPGCVAVVLDGKRSVLAFDGSSQKSGKAQLAPLAPEAVELLESLQRDQGFVFRPKRQNGEVMARHVVKISKIICKFGKTAGVVVDPENGKFASAHDLRRAFGFRWSRRLKSVAMLKELMRHASIETTMTYYVGQNAASTSSELWNALGDISGGAGEKVHASTNHQNEESPEKQGVSK